MSTSKPISSAQMVKDVLVAVVHGTNDRVPVDLDVMTVRIRKAPGGPGKNPVNRAPSHNPPLPSPFPKFPTHTENTIFFPNCGHNFKNSKKFASSRKMLTTSPGEDH